MHAGWGKLHKTVLHKNAYLFIFIFIIYLPNLKNDIESIFSKQNYALFSYG